MAIKSQVRSARAADTSGPVVQRREVTGDLGPKERKQVLRPADLQPTVKPTKACPLQEGDAVVLAKARLRESSGTRAPDLIGMIVAQVQVPTSSRHMTINGPMYEVMWSNGQIGVARGTSLRKIVDDPDL
jgi:hypothetical protein